jgi:TIR domain
VTTAFIGHARQDRAFARELAEFLEFGCDLTCYADDGLIGEDQDLISKAEEGLSADVLLLLLTRASSPSRWVRERWERVLFDEAKRGGVDVIPVLLEECFFPQLLRRRGNFVDATANWLTARRLVKRWCWSREHGPGASPGCEVSSDLEHLYSALSDRAGLLEAGGADTWRFASEAEQEFELVLWVPCQGRTVAQAAGELGRQLGLRLDGPVNQNCGRIRDLLAPRRCLVVLDAPTPEIVAELIAGGRTSTAVTRETVRTLETPATPAYARELIAAGRYAEAYELLYGLLDAVIDPETCARELTWICEHWDRIEEANVLRFNYGPPGTEQLALF